MQKFLDQFDGVISTEVGYANGPDKVPTYEDVCSNSGHAETVKVVYDKSKISLTKLLGFYFMVIDPLSVNRQGNDRGILKMNRSRRLNLCSENRRKKPGQSWRWNWNR